MPVPHPALLPRSPRRAALALLAAAAAVAVPVLVAALPAVTGAASGRHLAPPTAEAWAAPVEPVAVVEPFDGPAAPWVAGHRGVDLDAPVGTAVRAPRDGTVTFATVVVDRPVLTVRHDDGLRSSVEPVDAAVAVGDRVGRGQVVGTVAGVRSHCVPACLHWGVRDGEVYLDPVLLLRGGPVVLLSRGPPRSGAPAAAASPRCASGRCGTP
ncbi:M23 family metallopeptidase [Cellulomonas sp. Marseille-Q8402]